MKIINLKFFHLNFNITWYFEVSVLYITKLLCIIFMLFELIVLFNNNQYYLSPCIPENRNYFLANLIGRIIFTTRPYETLVQKSSFYSGD